MCVYMEAAEPAGIMEKMVKATDPFYTWFNQAVLADVHGITASGQLPPADEVVLDIF